MQMTPLALHRRLDELAFEALGPPAPLPVVDAADSEVSIEIVWEDDDVDDLAATGRFVRFSAPYERVEIAEVPSLANFRVRASRPTTFARTISAAEVAARAVSAAQTVTMPAMPAMPAPASATVPFERVWFDDREETLAAIEDAPVEAKTSWWWLAISLVAGAAAVAAMAIAFR